MPDNNDAFFGAAMGAMCGTSGSSKNSSDRAGSGCTAVIGIALLVGIFVAFAYLFKWFVIDIPTAVYETSTKRSLIACLVFGIFLFIVSIIGFCFAGFSAGYYWFVPIMSTLQILCGIAEKNKKTK